MPLPFFRTQSQVVLGLLVLAALDQARAGGPALAFWVLVAAAVLAYLSAVAWGLGLPRLGSGTAAVAASPLPAGWPPRPGRLMPACGLLNAASRLASGFLLGATLTAMLLGHYYLTAPAMSIEPLKRVVALMAWGLAARCLLAAIGCGLSHAGSSGSGTVPLDRGRRRCSWPPAGAWDLWAAGDRDLSDLEDRGIRSTQSATGILYITMIFVLFGELTSLVLAGREESSVDREDDQTVLQRTTFACVTSGFGLLPGSFFTRRTNRLQSSRWSGRDDTGPASVGRRSGAAGEAHGADFFVSELRGQSVTCRRWRRRAARCRHCGHARPLRSEAIVRDQVQSCPWCLTTDLYIQKDFPQGLGLFIVVVGFAISTVFWYYEMPIPAYLVLVVSMLLDLRAVSHGRRRHDLLSVSVPVAGSGCQSRRPIPAVRSGGRRTIPAGTHARRASARARGTAE